MAKLIFSIEGVVMRDIPLTKERTTIGRKPVNDIQIDHLAVSGEHAAIFTLLNDAFIEDLNSTNGTYVNGKPVRRHLLQNGDVIELGKHKFKFVSDPPPADSSAEYERTMVLRGPGQAPVAPPPPAPQPPAEPEAALPRAALRVLDGPAAGRSLDLLKSLTSVGKTGGDVAVITRHSGGYFIASAGGSPALVNGRPVQPQSPAQPLHDHDIIEIGGVRVEFFLRP